MKRSGRMNNSSSHPPLIPLPYHPTLLYSLRDTIQSDNIECIPPLEPASYDVLTRHFHLHSLNHRKEDRKDNRDSLLVHTKRKISPHPIFKKQSSFVRTLLPSTPLPWRLTLTHPSPLSRPCRYNNNPIITQSSLWLRLLLLLA